jgi:hypothetical protein
VVYRVMHRVVDGVVARVAAVAVAGLAPRRHDGTQQDGSIRR